MGGGVIIFMVEKTQDSLKEFMQIRVNFARSAYKPDIFDPEHSIFETLNQTGSFGRFPEYRSPDQGVFFDTNNLKDIPSYREHLLRSFQRMKDYSISIRLIREMVAIPEAVLLADIRNSISFIGASDDRMISTSDTEALPLMRLLYPDLNVLNHEKDHTEAGIAAGDNTSFFLHNLYLSIQRDGKEVHDLGRCVAHHVPTLNIYDNLRTALAPKHLSNGDLTIVGRLLQNVQEKDLPSDIVSLLKSKSDTICYVSRTGRRETVPVHTTEYRGFPIVKNWYNRDLENVSYFDPRDYSLTLGTDYLVDKFSELAKIDKTRISVPVAYSLPLGAFHPGISWDAHRKR